MHIQTTKQKVLGYKYQHWCPLRILSSYFCTPTYFTSEPLFYKKNPSPFITLITHKMPWTYISFQEKAEVAIFVDRTKRNLPFEDQIMLSPVDIEYRNIMSMRAALVETENERRCKHPFGKKQVSVYREQHGKVSTLLDSVPSDPSPVDKSSETHLHPYSQCQVPASFQLVPEYVQPQPSKAAILKEKSYKTLRGKSRIILAPTAFYTENSVAITPISTSYDAHMDIIPSTSERDLGSVIQSKP